MIRGKRSRHHEQNRPPNEYQNNCTRAAVRCIQQRWHVKNGGGAIAGSSV